MTCQTKEMCWSNKHKTILNKAIQKSAVKIELRAFDELPSNLKCTFALQELHTDL